MVKRIEKTRKSYTLKAGFSLAAPIIAITLVASMMAVFATAHKGLISTQTAEKDRDRRDIMAKTIATNIVRYADNHEDNLLPKQHVLGTLDESKCYVSDLETYDDEIYEETSLNGEMTGLKIPVGWRECSEDLELESVISLIKTQWNITGNMPSDIRTPQLNNLQNDALSNFAQLPSSTDHVKLHSIKEISNAEQFVFTPKAYETQDINIHYCVTPGEVDPETGLASSSFALIFPAKDKTSVRTTCAQALEGKASRGERVYVYDDVTRILADFNANTTMNASLRCSAEDEHATLTDGTFDCVTETDHGVQAFAKKVNTPVVCDSDEIMSVSKPSGTFVCSKPGGSGTLDLGTVIGSNYISNGLIPAVGEMGYGHPDWPAVINNSISTTVSQDVNGINVNPSQFKNDTSYTLEQTTVHAVSACVFYNGVVTSAGSRIIKSISPNAANIITCTSMSYTFFATMPGATSTAIPVLFDMVMDDANFISRLKTLKVDARCDAIAYDSQDGDFEGMFSFVVDAFSSKILNNQDQAKHRSNVTVTLNYKNGSSEEHNICDQSATNASLGSTRQTDRQTQLIAVKDDLDSITYGVETHSHITHIQNHSYQPYGAAAQMEVVYYGDEEEEVALAE